MKARVGIIFMLASMFIAGEVQAGNRGHYSGSSYRYASYNTSSQYRHSSTYSHYRYGRGYGGHGYGRGASFLDENYIPGPIKSNERSTVVDHGAGVYSVHRNFKTPNKD